jgi:hypothetical protein
VSETGGGTPESTSEGAVQESRKTKALRYTVYVLFTIALGGLTLTLFLRTPPPRLTHDSALDAIFDYAWMIAAARIFLVVIGIFAVFSVVIRATRGEWASSLGPVSMSPVAKSTQSVLADRDTLRAQVKEQEEEIGNRRAEIRRLNKDIDGLQDSLSAANEIIGELSHDVDELLAYLDTGETPLPDSSSVDSLEDEHGNDDSAGSSEEG